MIKEVSMSVVRNDFNLFINRMDLSSFPKEEYKKWDRKQKACFNLTFKGDEKPECKIFIKNIRTDKETGKKKCIVVLESKRKIFKYWNVNLDEIDHWITKSIGGGEINETTNHIKYASGACLFIKQNTSYRCA